MSSSSTPHGRWPSPLTPRSLASAMRLGDVAWADDGQALLWSGGRGAQTILVAQRGLEASADLFSEHSARGGVGYGGGELAVGGRSVYFPNRDGRLYQVDLDVGTPRPLTPAFGATAHAAPSPCGRAVVYVHTDQREDVLGAVDAQGQRWPQKLVFGADFYMQPAWHPRGESLAWIAWDHPQMPWDGARLELAQAQVTEDGQVRLGHTQHIAGDTRTSVQQPCYSPDGRWLAYVSDATGYAHLYVHDLQTGQTRQLSEGEADHAGPAWVQGLRSIGWAPDSLSIWAIRQQSGLCALVRYGLDGCQHPSHNLSEYEHLAQLAVSPQGQLALIASASQLPARLIVVDPQSWAVRVARRSSDERVPPQALSRAQPRQWRSSDGQTVHGLYYAPTHPTLSASGPAPLMVMVHGGPTSQALPSFNARNQLFATRGWAVLDVNYRGSTGYGRAYMEALRGQWGVLDVEDAISGARALIEAGLVDPRRIAIMGGSAGGYTVLQALTDHPGFFAAGISMYGISDLFALTMSTHKFESRYNDSLLGVLPQDAARFRERSPLYKVQRLRDALALFQGDEDKVVPPEQAALIAASLRARGVEHLYHVYAGEGHGWRKPETIEHFYQAVLTFVERHVLYR